MPPSAKRSTSPGTTVMPRAANCPAWSSERSGCRCAKNSPGVDHQHAAAGAGEHQSATQARRAPPITITS
jgi:hypothetical protein